MTIKWIFIDVGNVLVNDDPWMAVVYERVYQAILSEGYALSLDDFFREREALVKDQDGGHWRMITEKYLGHERWQQLSHALKSELADNYLKYNIPFPQINDVLKQLALTYRLALAANQSVHCRKALQQADMLQYFDIHGISDEIGLEKPSSEFFVYLLGQAQCDPCEAVMIGDRIDNDISPAKKLGMRTIWLKYELHNKGYQPKTDFERRYFESLAQASISRKKNVCEENQPDITISTISDIPEAVKMIGK